MEGIGVGLRLTSTQEVEMRYGLTRDESGELSVCLPNPLRERVAIFDGVDLTLWSDFGGRHIRYTFRHERSGAEEVKVLVRGLLSVGEEALGLFLYGVARAQTDFGELAHTFFEGKVRGTSNKSDYLTLADGSVREFGSVVQYGRERVEYCLERGAYLGSFSARDFRSELDDILRRGEEGLDARLWIGSMEFARSFLRGHGVR